MRWEDFRQSGNIEDRRGDDGGGGGGGLPFGGGGLGIGTMVVLGILGYALGIDPRLLISGAEMATGGSRSGYSEPQRQTGKSATTPPTDDTGRFVSAILAQTEDVWSEILPAQKGIKYTPPRLVLFSGQTASACGRAANGWNWLCRARKSCLPSPCSIPIICSRHQRPNATPGRICWRYARRLPKEGWPDRPDRD